MKILTLHGGGMMGYMTLCYLERLEEETGKSVPEMFDLIAGDSTGSIIAAGYAVGKTTSEIRVIYEDFYEKVFKKKRSFFMSLFKPSYEIENLERNLKEVLGVDSKISDSKVKMMFHSVQIAGDSKLKTFKTKFWKSWKDDDILYKICCASSAAPSLFAPYKIDDSYYIDGGIATNNPSMCAVAEAVKMGEKLEDIELVSLWTEMIPPIAKPSKMVGLLKVMVNIGNLFTQAGEDVVDYQVNQIIKNLVVVRPDVSFSIDTNNFDVMKKFADSEWTQNGAAVVALVND